MTDPGRAKLLLGDAYAGFRVLFDASGLALAFAASVDALFIEYAAFADLDCWLECLETEIAPLFENLPGSVAAKVTLAEFSALSFRRPDSPRLGEVRSQLIRCIDLSKDPDFVSRARGQLFIYSLWHGDNIETVNQLESIMEIARLPNSAPLRRLFAQVLEITHCTITADYDVSNAKIEACIRLADESGIHVWDGIIRGNRVCTLIAQGRYSEAASHLPAWRASLQNEWKVHMSRYQAAAAYLAAKSQAATFSRDLCAKALMSAERAGAPTFQLNTWLMVAATLNELDSMDGDADALLQSVLTRTRNFNPQLHWVALLVSAGIAAQRNVDAAAIALVEQAFRLGAERSYWHFANWPRELIGRACEVAIQHGIEPTYATELIRRNDLQPSASEFHLGNWPWRIKIRALGRFAVIVDGQPVTFSSKAQKMPFRLLQALVALGGREVSEVKLSDLLWPEAEGDAAAASLSVTLHRLRRLLQVDCLARQDGRLSLDSRLVWVDVWAFERTLADSRAVAQLSVSQLRSLYQGAFLQELDSTPWALPPRERLRDKLVAFISGRSKQLIGERRHAEAEELLAAGLEIDDLVEDFYRLLMRCQEARDDVSAALQTYNRCERVLAARLMIRPSATTKALRAELLQRGGQKIGD
jgi:DNA-binding SARP family transcriptional activator